MQTSSLIKGKLAYATARCPYGKFSLKNILLTTVVLFYILCFSKLQNQNARTYGTVHSVSLHWNFSAMNRNQCRSSVVKPRQRGTALLRVDSIFDEGPFEFQRNFKNPCFYKNSLFSKRLHCLPYFYLIGFPKCGTTDLWDRIILHPEVVANHNKESQYLEYQRFLTDNKWTFDKYLEYLSPTADAIYQNGSNKQEDGYHHMVTGDGSVNIAAVNDLWQYLPENDGCSEPRITNADYLKHINPNVKLILMMRDPVDRLWSDYLYLAPVFHYTTSPQTFHYNAVNAIQNYKDCLKYFTPRGCAYNSSIDSLQMRLRVGLYETHLSDWLRVFPRQQMLIIRTEDYHKNVENVLKTVFSFLQIKELPKDGVDAITMNKKSNVQTKHSVMLEETKTLLYEFYEPFNRRLSLLLNDTRFYWHRRH